MVQDQATHTENDENESVISWAYKILLGRDVDPEGRQHWLTRLRNGLPREAFLTALMRSGEFSAHLGKLGILENDRWTIAKELQSDLIVPLLPNRPDALQFRVPIRDESVTQGLIDNRGIWESHISKLLTSILSEGDTFIDVGANFGYFTLLGSRLVGTSGTVMAFEPMSVNRRYCEANISLNHLSNVTLFPYGLWSEEATMDIGISDTFHGGAYLLATPASISSGIAREQIMCTSFDVLAKSQNLQLQRLKVIKIDIEGSEPFALDGLSQTVQRYRPFIVMEVNRHCLRTLFHVDSDAIWQRLHAFGYEVCVFPEQYPSAEHLPPYKEIADQELRKVDSLDILNAMCPEEGLIDVLAIPR